MRTGQSKTIFAGRKGFCFASALVSKRQDFVSAAQEGAGGMRGGFVFDFWRGSVLKKPLKLCYTILMNSDSIIVSKSIKAAKKKTAPFREVA